MKFVQARTAIYVTAALAVGSLLTPGVAWATNTAMTIITDANGNKAQVNSAGELAVHASGTVNVGNLPATQPVSGSVNVGNLPATQPVSGSVNVANLPATQAVTGTVTIGNSDPVPFQTEASGRLDSQFPKVSFTVPAGKRLLVDFITISASAYGGSIDPSAEISGTYGGQFVRFMNQLVAAPASYGTSYGSQQQVRMSFDAGSTVQLDVQRTSGSDGLLFFNVHGELIPN